MKWNATTRLAIGCAGMLAATATVLAHHSFAAQYDSGQLVTLQGTVTKVEWMNPHTFFYVDVMDDEGQSTNWAVEGGYMVVPEKILNNFGAVQDAIINCPSVIAQYAALYALDSPKIAGLH